MEDWDITMELTKWERSVVDGAFDPEALEAYGGYEKAKTIVKKMAEAILMRFVFWPTGGTGGLIVDQFTGEMMAPKSFGTTYPHGVTALKELPSGGKTEERLKAVPYWLGDTAKTVIGGMSFRPGNPSRLVPSSDPGGFPGLNVWKPPAFDIDSVTEEEKDEAWGLFLDYIEHLFPDADDRDYVLNWVFCLVKHPEERGVALTMVDPSGGTGKNTLYKLLSKLVGEKFAGPAKFKALLGQGSGFDDTYINKVLLYCAEALTTGRSREADYENLKVYIDPDPQQIVVNSKFVREYTTDLYHSTLISSNTPRKALPIHAGDRRFSIVDTTSTPLDSPTCEKAEKAKRAVDAFLPRGKEAKEIDKAHRLTQALYVVIHEQQATLDLFRKPLFNAARQTVIDGGDGLIERALEDYLDYHDHAPGFIFADLVDAISKKLESKRGTDEVQEVLRARLTQYHERHDGGDEVAGFCGWRMSPAKEDAFTPPEDVKMTTSEGRIKFKTAGRGRWFVKGLVVPAEEYPAMFEAGTGQAGKIATQKRGRVVAEIVRPKDAQITPLNEGFSAGLTSKRWAGQRADRSGDIAGTAN